jgi:hypothetical protein
MNKIVSRILLMVAIFLAFPSFPQNVTYAAPTNNLWVKQMEANSDDLYILKTNGDLVVKKDESGPYFEFYSF